ncbi:doubled motif LPXTG anchor domain-containing protein, partial [Hungatella hathewayi]|uniref:doubled motif LPXTG anchor domain-containing protein n=1 Tax=Hungatella hathewayi TaxID=154046 RepID=UPI0022E04079
AVPGLHYGDATPEEPDAGNNHEAGWKFIGWSPEVEATVSKTVTYVAQWEQEAYTVIYLPGRHGTFETTAVRDLHYGDTTPEAPDAMNQHEAGWSFAGWDPMPESTVSGNATYIAQWSQDEYTVIYQPGEHGTFEEASTPGLHYGDITPEGPNAAENHENGWSFTGWSPSVEITVNGSAIYVAQWSRDEYTVTYRPGDYGTFEEQTTVGLHYGDIMPESPNAADNHVEGWSFTGWSPSPELTVTGNVVYVAQYQINNHTVTYMVDGQNYGEVETYQYGVDVMIKEDPTKEGSTFSGWSVKESFKMPDYDIIIQGTFKANSYIVTYMVDESPYGNAEFYNYGDNVIVKEALFKEGYTFSGWDRTGTFNMPAENIIIKGDFKVNSYKVTYKVDGETYGNVEIHEYNTPVNVKSNPTKSGYTFSGWDRMGTFNMPAEDIVIEGIFIRNSSSGGNGGGSTPNENKPYQPGGPGDNNGPTVTIDPDAVPLANAPVDGSPTDNLILIDDGNVPLAGLPKTGDRAGAQAGLAAILSGFLLAAFSMLNNKKKEENK